MLCQIIMGYIPLCKCATFGSLIICFLPCIIRGLRRANRPDGAWVGAPRNVLSNMVRANFRPQDHDGTVECAICFMEYDENSQIIKLPCDERHFFHADCIENWLK